MSVNRKAALPPKSPLAERVLFIDAEALVIDKPGGLPVDPPRDGALSLTNHLGGFTFGFARWPLPVHRLDRDTSGCLLLARNPKAHKRFTQAFEARLVTKAYVAVLEGAPVDDSGMIDLPLGKTSSARDGWRMVVDPQGKAARTAWHVLERANGRSLVRFLPETGRTHQIRAHVRYGLGMGIVGDPIYSQPDDGAMLLHALSLALERPGKLPVSATAPLPPGFAAAGFALP